MSDHDYDELMNHANNWRYLMTLKSISLTSMAAKLAHSKRTTKADLDAWLMRRFTLSPSEARQISNHSMGQIDFKIGRTRELRWVADRPEPTWEEYPELREYIAR